jgi:flagellar hook-basal body complex protein FliE
MTMPTAIESIAAAAAITPAGVSQLNATRVASTGDVFGNLLTRGLGDLNTNVGAAEEAVRSLASGQPVALHEVMISLERARLSVQTFVQVRNKLIESYQDLMRMQM